MQSNNEKTLNAVAGKQSREEGNRNTYQGVPMNTTVPRIPAHFDTAIKVAGVTVNTGTLTGGHLPDWDVVTLRTHDELLSLSPAEALALASALQSVAIHILESTDGKAA